MIVRKKQPPKEQKEIIDKLQKQSNEYLAGWQRCKADFENYRKQQEEWAKDYCQRATEDLIFEIVPVLDNFELALNHLPQNPDARSWSEGIAHIKRQLEEVLEKNKVKKIEVKPGDPFNPNLHECVNGSQIEDSSERQPPNSKKQKIEFIVKEVMLTGYYLNNRVLRPTKVTVKNNYVK
jgi:molecular chaperone GrpE